MARRSRQDHPGAWHHVVNRGIAKRPLFEDRTDVRYFLSRLAREVWRGRLEIHAWCVLTTHFHLLVRSPAGELSEALRRSQNEYSRFFNRRHGRDGTLVRGRFLSRPVETLAYRRILLRYIDRNPVKAGLATAPWRYAWGSAAQYVYARGPAWLERGWVESEVRTLQGRASFRGDDYVRTFRRPRGAGEGSLVDERLRARRPGPDELDELVDGAPPAVRAWMRRKARLADGVPLGQPVCDKASVRKAVAEARTALGSWTISPNGQARNAWDLAEAGLLRTLAALPWEEVSRACRSTLATCQRRFGLHARLLVEDALYLERLSALTRAALLACLDASARRRRSG